MITAAGQAIARILMAVALVLALWTLRGGQRSSDDVNECRSQVAADLSAATADFLLATGDRVTDGDTAIERRRFFDAQSDLRDARDARLAFEDQPTANCAP